MKVQTIIYIIIPAIAFVLQTIRKGPFWAIKTALATFVMAALAMALYESKKVPKVVQPLANSTVKNVKEGLKEVKPVLQDVGLIKKDPTPIQKVGKGLKNVFFATKNGIANGLKKGGLAAKTASRLVDFIILPIITLALLFGLFKVCSLSVRRLIKL